ncbi:MAG TPA: response regulator [Myxococcales bacterium]|nr:response regulator [Myxococcales bacterium]
MPKIVLVVDDSPTIRGFCRLALRPLSIEIAEAEEGAQALEAVRRAPPSLIIVDVNMPGMDGISFVRALRADADAAVRGVPVLLLTGDRDAAIRARGLEAGANEFVEKPIKPPALQQTVRRYLGEPAQ